MTKDQAAELTNKRASRFVHTVRVASFFPISHTFCNIVIVYINVKNINALSMSNLSGLKVQARPC